VDDLNEGLNELSHEDLLQLLLGTRQKYRKLEEELQAYRRRCEMREDTWLRLLATRQEGMG